jgi:hypothetical protein
MRFLLRALPLLLSVTGPASAPAQQALPPSPSVHVRWIVNLKKAFGYENFKRAQAGNKTWKQQQGITFITPQEVLVYQLRKTDGASPRDAAASRAPFRLLVRVLDAGDGHEIKSLALPVASEPARILPTRGGAFVVQAGNVLTVYSPKFEPAASKDLPLSPDATSQEWQIDVSPAGTRVVAIHQQEWRDRKQKPVETESEADVEVLDAETLQTVKSFSVGQVDAWSAGDDVIITTDPDGVAGNVAFGILDFDGNWHGLHTPAENADRDCPYQMQPLEHQLIAAFDCDELVVVSSDGALRMSQPVRSGNFLISIAHEDHYLAEAFVQPDVSRAYVSVFDLNTKALVLRVSLEHNDIYYTVASTGILAVVDGERLKVFEAGAAGEAASDQAPPAAAVPNK